VQEAIHNAQEDAPPTVHDHKYNFRPRLQQLVKEDAQSDAFSDCLQLQDGDDGAALLSHNPKTY
jgi:hypothetical protein